MQLSFVSITRTVVMEPCYRCSWTWCTHSNLAALPGAEDVVTEEIFKASIRDSVTYGVKHYV